MKNDVKQLAIIGDKISKLMTLVWDLSHSTKNEYVHEATAKAWIVLSDMDHDLFDVAWNIKNLRKKCN